MFFLLHSCTFEEKVFFFQIATALLHLLHTKKSWELFWDWQRSTPNSSFEAYSNGINSRQVHIWKGLAETNPHSGAKVSRTVKNSQWSKKLFIFQKLLNIHSQFPNSIATSLCHLFVTFKITSNGRLKKSQLFNILENYVFKKNNSKAKMNEVLSV